MSRAFLKPSEQSTIATVTAVLLAVALVAWLVGGGLSGRLVEIDQAEPVPYEFLVDANTATWPAVTSLQLFDPLGFSRDDLREFPFDHRHAPAVEKASEVILAKLAGGPVIAPEVIAAVVAAGWSRSAAYKAKHRMGVESIDGCWVLRDAPRTRAI